MSFVLLGILNSQAAAGGGGVVAAYDYLDSYEVATPVTQFSFTSLVSTYGSDYQHLEFRVRDTSTIANGYTYVHLNNDTTAGSYHRQTMRSANASSLAGSKSPTDSAWLASYHEGGSGNIGRGLFRLMFFADTTRTKPLYSFFGDNLLSREDIGYYDSTSAVDSVKFLMNNGSNDFSTGSYVDMYGIR